MLPCGVGCSWAAVAPICRQHMSIQQADVSGPLGGRRHKRSIGARWSSQHFRKRLCAIMLAATAPALVASFESDDQALATAVAAAGRSPAAKTVTTGPEGHLGCRLRPALHVAMTTLAVREPCAERCDKPGDGAVKSAHWQRSAGRPAIGARGPVC